MNVKRRDQATVLKEGGSVRGSDEEASCWLSPKISSVWGNRLISGGPVVMMLSPITSKHPTADPHTFSPKYCLSLCLAYQRNSPSQKPIPNTHR